MAYNNGDAMEAPTTYEEVSKFTMAMRDRLEHLQTEAANAEETARVARMRADEAQRVYETLAKLHETMQPKVDLNATIGGTVNVTGGPYTVRY